MFPRTDRTNDINGVLSRNIEGCDKLSGIRRMTSMVSYRAMLRLWCCWENESCDNLQLRL